MRRLAATLLILSAVGAPALAQQRVDPLVASSDDPLVLQQYAIEFYRQNRPYDALAALRKAAGLYGSNAETHMWLGIVYTRIDDLATAEAEFERAIELNPGLTEVHNWYGLYWMRRGDLERALAEYALALEDPAYPRISRARVLLNMGNALMQAERYAEATPLLSEAFRTTLPSNDPAFVWIRLALSDTLIKTGRPDEALSVLEELSVLPDNARANFLAGLAHRDLGEFDKAHDRLSRVVRMEPGSVLADEAKQVMREMDRDTRSPR